MGRGARRRILEDWNYDRLFAPVVERMVSAVPAPLRVTERGRA
jgi:hypothetical protein